MTMQITINISLLAIGFVCGLLWGTLTRKQLIEAAKEGGRQAAKEMWEKPASTGSVEQVMCPAGPLIAEVSTYRDNSFSVGGFSA